MGKRARIHSTYSQQTGCFNSNEDQISLLSDEILIFILSFLTIKEAAVTSRLAKRWRYLWASSSSSLNFDAEETLNKVAVQNELLDEERVKYVNWVNSVLESFNGPSLKEFRVCFDLHYIFQCSIDKWIEYALAFKGLEKLELDLSGDIDNFYSHRLCYTFPVNLFFSGNTCPSFLAMKPCSFLGIKSLRSLCLKNVNVNGQVLSYFLSHCPLLERLSLFLLGPEFSDLVVGPSHMLKHLELVSCMGLKNVVISSTNLVSFKYEGKKINLLLNYVPMLVEVSIREGYSQRLTYLFGQLSCCLSQLEILTLDLSYIEHSDDSVVFPEFPNAKHLVVETRAMRDNGDLLKLSPLMKACPYLENFIVKVIWALPERRRKRRVQEAAFTCHEYLKVMEFKGYYGRTSDVELLSYIFKTAINLEKIIVHPRDPFFSRIPSSGIRVGYEKSAIRYAQKQLPQMVPRGVELVIV